MANDKSTRRDIVVVGASAGGVEALMRFVSVLPADFPAAVFVVLHVSPVGSLLPSVLGRTSRLPVAHAVDGEPVEPGRVYVAPPDRHLLLEDGRVRVAPGPRQNGHRPAIDPLFRSAAWAYGPRVAGVVLSGVLDDGALGCRTITQYGGVTLVQSPEDAAYPSMPQSAIDHDDPSFVGSVEAVASELVDLARGLREHVAAAEDIVGPPMVEAPEGHFDRRLDGEISPFTCPECNGTLWEVADGASVRYRCRVGHSYSAGAMDVAQGTSVEAALWTALRALEERAALKRRLGERLGPVNPRSQSRLDEDAMRMEEHAAVLRGVLDDVTEQGASKEPIVGGAE